MMSGEFDKFDFEYMDYIVEHKKNVMKAFNILYPKISEVLTLDSDILELKKNVLEHDNSKFTLLQFEPYCDKFFRKLECGDSFEKAWCDHYYRERHHPEGFLIYKMKDKHIVEMCLDWHAMSLKFGDSSLDYFQNKKSKLAEESPWLEDSFAYIEKILRILNGVEV